ncbi:MAG: DUF2007 domain-containing protein [Phycisphaerales bacterium]|nr:MAG: DUF2007 domain-containing protein [Phycisphaerales bacterium]
MAEELVTVARFTDYIEAELAKQVLEDFGIKAVVTGENVANVYSGLPALMDLELQTLTSRAQEAIEILESHNKPGDAEQPDKPDDAQE